MASFALALACYIAVVSQKRLVCRTTVTKACLQLQWVCRAGLALKCSIYANICMRRTRYRYTYKCMCVYTKDLGNELAQSSACHKAMPQGSNIGQQTADNGLLLGPSCILACWNSLWHQHMQLQCNKNHLTDDKNPKLYTILYLLKQISAIIMCSIWSHEKFPGPDKMQ